jgi:hypothetical protein
MLFVLSVISISRLHRSTHYLLKSKRLALFDSVLWISGIICIFTLLSIYARFSTHCYVVLRMAVNTCWNSLCSNEIKRLFDKQLESDLFLVLCTLSIECSCIMSILKLNLNIAYPLKFTQKIGT